MLPGSFLLIDSILFSGVGHSLLGLAGFLVELLLGDSALFEGCLDLAVVLTDVLHEFDNSLSVDLDFGRSFGGQVID